MPCRETLAHLTQLYAAEPDPWRYLSSHTSRRSTTRPSPLDERGFRGGLEVGCGNGALAARPAPLCQGLAGVECVPAAAGAARRNLAEYARVQVVDMDVLEGLPVEGPDLIVLSEVLYFLEPEEIDTFAGRVAAEAAPDAPARGRELAGGDGTDADGTRSGGPTAHRTVVMTVPAGGETELPARCLRRAGRVKCAPAGRSAPAGYRRATDLSAKGAPGKSHRTTYHAFSIGREAATSCVQ